MPPEPFKRLVSGPVIQPAETAPGGVCAEEDNGESAPLTGAPDFKHGDRR